MTYPVRERVKSIYQRLLVKMWQFLSFFSAFLLKIVFLKEYFKFLKTTSGSSSRTDLSNIITFRPSQSHATVPLKGGLTTVDTVQNFILGSI